MVWIWIAILSHFFWALSNIGSKYVVANKIKNPYVYAIWAGIFGLLVAVLIPFIDFVVPSGELLGWLILASALYFFGGFPYVKALQMEDVTRINIWWSFIPLFSFGIAWFAIGEKLNGGQILALALLIMGAVMASIHKQLKGFKFSKAFWLMIISTLAFALYAVIIRHVTGFMNIASVFVWVYLLIGIFAGLMLVFRPVRAACARELQHADRPLFAAVAGVAIVDYIGLWLNIWALSLGPAALVYAMEGFQAVMVFLMAMSISAFTHISLKEELDKYNVALKILALLLMIGGVWMISVA